MHLIIMDSSQTYVCKKGKRKMLKQLATHQSQDSLSRRDLVKKVPS